MTLKRKTTQKEVLFAMLITNKYAIRSVQNQVPLFLSGDNSAIDVLWIGQGCVQFKRLVLTGFFSSYKTTGFINNM